MENITTKLSLAFKKLKWRKIKRELDAAIDNQQWKEARDLLDRHRDLIEDLRQSVQLLPRAVMHITPADLVSPPNINMQNTDGDTALHEALRGTRWDLVPVLLQHRADFNVRNSYNQTPLHWAAHRGAPANIVTRLISPHNINMRDYYGNTALHEAVRWRRWDLVPLLLQYGAVDSSQQDQPFIWCLYLAVCITTIRSHMPVKSDAAYEGLGLPGKLVAEVKLRPQAEDIVKRSE